jgi:hypothetical protein
METVRRPHSPRSRRPPTGSTTTAISHGIVCKLLVVCSPTFGKSGGIKRGRSFRAAPRVHLFSHPRPRSPEPRADQFPF